MKIKYYLDEETAPARVIEADAFKVAILPNGNFCIMGGRSDGELALGRHYVAVSNVQYYEVVEED